MRSLKESAAQALTMAMGMDIVKIEVELDRLLQEVAGMSVALAPDAEHFLTAWHLIHRDVSVDMEATKDIFRAYGKLKTLVEIAGSLKPKKGYTLREKLDAEKRQYLFWIANGELQNLGLSVSNFDFSDLYIDLEDDEMRGFNDISFDEEKIVKAMFQHLTYLTKREQLPGLGNWEDSYMKKKGEILQWFWAETPPSASSMRRVLEVDLPAFAFGKSKRRSRRRY